jgi:hypothetical protein
MRDNRKPKRSFMARIVLVGLLLSGVIFLLYCNRVKIRRMGGGEAPEYVAKVKEAYVAQRDRLVAEISVTALLNSTSGEAIRSGPRIDGRVAVFGEYDMSPRDGKESQETVPLLLKPKGLHASHFEVPKALRADDPGEAETLVLVGERAHYTYTRVGGDGVTYNETGFTVRVYNRKAGTLYQVNTKIPPSDINEYVVKLVGG